MLQSAGQAVGLLDPLSTPTPVSVAAVDTTGALSSTPANKTAAPLPSPTVVPTSAPTVIPTAEPTQEPTQEPPTPTQEPTQQPPTATPAPTSDPLAYPVMPDGLPEAQVVEIIDGDTVDVLLNGKVERLRLIGLDTPETKDPRKPVQCFGKEASAQAAKILTGQTVLLEEDASQDTRDKYDRLLRYVWLPDGKLYNLEMIIGGFAHEYTYETPYKYQAVFKKEEAAARERGWGFWAVTSCNGNTEQAAEAPAPKPSAPKPAAPAQQPAAGGNCHPSYPDVCIPPAPPDLNCPDIPHKRFRVVGADPHKFDRNRDGIGCEK
ncbi:MAG: thermonuclease family protein [Chloroflexota bacterium]|nr:thermonuclease family protein [Chloroflexota bacterium]